LTGAASHRGPARVNGSAREVTVAESVDKVVELIGTQDLVIEDGKVAAYRAKLKVSFKYESRD
jgi:flavin-binding protein dodecin